jgi:hypothetical protein
LPAALIVLLLAAASHDLLAKLLYTKQIPTTAGMPDQIHLGAQIMYYGGSVIELLLATLVMTGWYQRSGRRLKQEQRTQVRKLSKPPTASAGRVLPPTENQRRLPHQNHGIPT